MEKENFNAKIEKCGKKEKEKVENINAGKTEDNTKKMRSTLSSAYFRTKLKEKKKSLELSKGNDISFDRGNKSVSIKIMAKNKEAMIVNIKNNLISNPFVLCLGNNVPNPFILGDNIKNPFSLFNQIPNKNVPKTKEKVNPQEAPHNKEEPNPKEKDEPNPKEKEEPNPKENEEPNPKEKEDKKSSRKKYYCEICGDFFPTVDKHIQRSHPEKLAIEKRIVVFLKDFAEFKRPHENVKKIIQSLTPDL